MKLDDVDMGTDSEDEDVKIIDDTKIIDTTKPKKQAKTGLG